MSSNQEFSSDIIFEILSRTTLLTLDTCKVVSKGWKQLIYESSFLPLYFKRTSNLFGYFVQDIINHKYVNEFVSIDEPEGGIGCINGSWPGDNMRILASCNQGILCCQKRKHKNHQYYVGKPATRQWQALPDPKLRYETAGVAIMVMKSKPLHYKIVRLSEIKIVRSMTKYYCEIFDSKIWAWTKTKGVNLPYDELILSNDPAVSIGGFAYWLTNKDNVLAFDIAQECFQKFSLPEPVCNNDSYRYKQLVEYEGRLGFTCLTKDRNMEVWLTTIPRSYEWTRKMVADISVLEENIKYPHPIGFCNSDIAFMKAFSKAIFYKLQDCGFITVEVDYGLRHACQIFQFRSDVECVDLRSGR